MYIRNGCPQFSSVTEVIMIFYYAVILFATTYCLDVLFKATGSDAGVYSSRAFIIIFECLLILGLVAYLKYRIVRFHKNYNIGRLQRCKNNMVIGLGGIAICGFLPRVLVFFLDPNIYIVMSLNYTIVFPVAATIFYFLFLFKFDEKCTWSAKRTLKCYGFYSIVLNILILFLMLNTEIFYPQKSKEAIQIVQCMFALICASSTTEFVLVWNGALKLRNDESRNNAQNEDVENNVIWEPITITMNKNAPLKSTTTMKKNDPILECKICMQEYNETRTPRILKECGHTVCEGCADNLLKKHKGHLLYCPFCQKVTVVNGPANLLPKNFTMLELVERKET